jgi:hypothetical protein
MAGTAVHSVDGCNACWQCGDVNKLRTGSLDALGAYSDSHRPIVSDGQEMSVVLELHVFDEKTLSGGADRPRNRNAPYRVRTSDLAPCDCPSWPEELTVGVGRIPLSLRPKTACCLGPIPLKLFLEPWYYLLAGSSSESTGHADMASTIPS